MDRIDKIKEMLKSAPGDEFLQHALALEYIKLGNDVIAKPLFESILNNNENYVGSYYHLAKLLEREGLYEDAVALYKKGIAACKKVGDKHAENELRMAMEEIIDD